MLSASRLSPPQECVPTGFQESSGRRAQRPDVVSDAWYRTPSERRLLVATGGGQKLAWLRWHQHDVFFDTLITASDLLHPAASLANICVHSLFVPNVITLPPCQQKPPVHLTQLNTDRWKRAMNRRNVSACLHAHVTRTNDAKYSFMFFLSVHDEKTKTNM